MGAWRTLMLPSRRMPAMKPVGERSAGNPHAAFDERGKRPSITWGDSCGMAKRAAGPSLSGRVILVEGPVDDRGADLEHQMRSSRRPTHLLVGAHPPVQQPMHRTLGGRRRIKLEVSPGGGIIDDQTGFWRVPSSRLLFAGRSLALVVFEPRLHELVEFLHLFVGVGFWRAVFQPTEHVSFD